MKKWLKLGYCLLLVIGFIYLSPKIFNRIPTYSQVIDNAEARGIDNSALFYSEEMLTSRAEEKLNEQLNPVYALKLCDEH